MIVIFTTCLTYFWLLIIVFQIQKSSFSLVIYNNMVIYTYG